MAAHVAGGRLEALAEHPVALGGDGGQQPGLVAEALADRRVADAGPVGDLAQAGLGDPVAGDLVLGRRDGGGGEVAVVVRPVAGASVTPSRSFDAGHVQRELARR